MMNPRRAAMGRLSGLADVSDLSRRQMPSSGGSENGSRFPGPRIVLPLMIRQALVLLVVTGCSAAPLAPLAAPSGPPRSSPYELDASELDANPYEDLDPQASKPVEPAAAPAIPGLTCVEECRVEYLTCVDACFPVRGRVDAQPRNVCLVDCKNAIYDGCIIACEKSQELEESQESNGATL